MYRYDTKTLTDVLELRRSRENELTDAVARAAASASAASQDEACAREIVEERHESLRLSDEVGMSELDGSCSAANLAERAAYRKGLVAAHKEALEALAERVERRKEAERALDLVRRDLAEAAAKRNATEKLLTRTELEIRRAAEDRLDDEIAELAGARTRNDEGPHQ